MNVSKSIRFVALAALGLVMTHTSVSGRARAATFKSGMPVRCEVWINNALTDQNVPMTCTTAEGDEYTNVPEGLDLYVTDIIVRRRLTGQTTVAASVRIWEEDGFSGTGCDAGSVIGSFVTDQYIRLADATVTGQGHVAYNTPYLVLTPNDCLAVYTSTESGLTVELSGYQMTSLGVPVANAFLPSVTN